MSVASPVEKHFPRDLFGNSYSLYLL
jgi:hypothetical protein